MRIFCMPSNGNKSQQVKRLLIKCVEDLYGIDPGPIAKTEFGKPYFPENPNICFSLSHTKTYVMCAVSSAPVGVDVQIRRNVSHLLPQRVCSPDELECFDFFDLWALKESFIKLHGKKDRDYKDIFFYIDSDGKVRSFDKNVCCKIYDTVPGCSCAVCSLEDEFPCNIEFLDEGLEFVRSS